GAVPEQRPDRREPCLATSERLRSALRVSVRPEESQGAARPGGPACPQGEALVTEGPLREGLRAGPGGPTRSGSGRRRSDALHHGVGRVPGRDEGAGGADAPRALPARLVPIHRRGAMGAVPAPSLIPTCPQAR